MREKTVYYDYCSLIYDCAFKFAHGEDFAGYTAGAASVGKLCIYTLRSAMNVITGEQPPIAVLAPAAH